MSKELERLGEQGYAKKIAYNNEYIKKTYKRINFYVKKEDKEELKDLLEKNNMTYSNFIELGIKLARRRIKKNEENKGTI